ncbi:hypothetical protein PIROE2DRAFT_57479 [Piromyces sp. E2]|nr:hypothetical protein PIROE2DRAFT_57479 [Piromyces sp. E2]|eukprot:OUM69437.1 hypothetical protein PIROE2DRAFT_57479 [Piromyces sp. E2]
MSGLFESVSVKDFHLFLKPEYDSNYKIIYDKNQNTMKTIYKVIFYIYIIIGLVSLGMFYHMRNWYIIKQRNFKLTFLNVTALKKKSNKFKFKESYIGEKEPNYYLPKVYKRVNNIIYAVIAIPTIVTLIITIIIHANSYSLCEFTPKDNSATEQLKSNNSGNLFVVAQISGIIMAIALTIMLFFLAKVKDSSKYGAKFECVSTIILIVVITIINFVLNSNVQSSIGRFNFLSGQAIAMKLTEGTTQYYQHIENGGLQKPGSSPEPFKTPIFLFLKMYDYTKGGRALFGIISCYIIFSSIILPIIKCYKSKKEKNKYFHEPTSSIQYFYKVLNSPPLIEELKSIAIKEFSVENVLFWENYQVLQKMVYRYQIEFKKAERVGNPRLVSQYDFEGYYQQQLQAFSVSSMDDYSYDPNMPVPRELMPYYVNFYHTFIDSLGPASVNISGACIKHIYGEMCTYPTIGMFDNAKNEIVEMMYSSIFPILLRQNRKQIRNLTIQY